MKKKLIIGIMILVVALVGVMAGCKTKFGISDMFAVASYQTNSPERNTVITVKDGDTTIFHSKNGKLVKEDCIKELNIKNLVKNEPGESLDFNSAYFENEELQVGNIKALYTADIKDVETFLGVADATDARIEIMASVEDESLISMRIYYSVQKKLAKYDVTIAVLEA